MFMTKAAVPAEAEKLIRAVAAECPNHIDALHHIGLFLGERGAALESYVFCQAAVAVGLHAIPTLSVGRVIGTDSPNRPFLRTCPTPPPHCFPAHPAAVPCVRRQ